MEQMATAVLVVCLCPEFVETNRAGNILLIIVLIRRCLPVVVFNRFSRWNAELSLTLSSASLLGSPTIITSSYHLRTQQEMQQIRTKAATAKTTTIKALMATEDESSSPEPEPEEYEEEEEDRLEELLVLPPPLTLSSRVKL